MNIKDKFEVTRVDNGWLVQILEGDDITKVMVAPNRAELFNILQGIIIEPQMADYGSLIERSLTAKNRANQMNLPLTD